MKLPSNATLEERERFAYIGGQVRFANVLATCADAEEYIRERNEEVTKIRGAFDLLHSQLEDIWCNTKHLGEI